MALALPNLEECAKIVYQHHERVDGSGYPEKISGSSITDGAKILAICDAFHSMTHSTPNKPLRKSILRAVVEINACRDKQFDSYWVDKFNTVVRTQRLGGFL
jgi:HD-GYP domain-containing protein (c-di-GMP phosphodiesterase class II)